MSTARSRLLALAVVSSLLLAACSGAASSPQPSATPAASAAQPSAAPSAAPAASAASPSAPAQIVPVRVGMTPFFDYQFFSVAKELGWDKALGLDLQFTWFTQSGPSTQALANGSIDTVNTCVVCNFPFYASVPELTDFLTTDQFKGFVIIGRVGSSKTYTDLLKQLGDPKAAQKAALEQVRGKTFPMYSANYETLLKAALGQAAMSITDVKITNFADDSKAALAFVGGTGDFYMGGLPSETSILQGHGTEFQVVGGAELLGPAGLWYSQVASSAAWLTSNEDAALKIMAMSYRFNRYVNEKPATVMPLVAKAMTDHGVASTVTDLGFTFNTFLTFRSYQDDAKTAYAPASPLYWGQSADYYVKQSTDLPANADYKRQNPLDSWFTKFMARSDLLTWVDAPLQ